MCPHVALKSNAGSADSTTHPVHVRLMVAGADGCCDWVDFLYFFLGSGDAIIFKHVGSVLHGASPLCPVLSSGLPLVGIYVAY